MLRIRFHLPFAAALIAVAPGFRAAAHPASLTPLPAGWRVATERMDGFPAEGLQLYALETSSTRAFCLA